MPAARIPSSVTMLDELPGTYVCEYCGLEKPADAEHFFPHRATGGLHLRSRCRECEKLYREGLAASAASGERMIQPRRELTRTARPEPDSLRSDVRMRSDHVRMRSAKEESPDPAPPSSFQRELEARIDDIFACHPELEDHRSLHPWATGQLGDPFATVWFVSENLSLRQMRRLPETASRESQWAISPGDLLSERCSPSMGSRLANPRAPEAGAATSQT